MDNTTWPKNFYDIGERPFWWVYKNKPEFVDFTETEMKDASGLFLAWQNYCARRNKKNDKATRRGTEKRSLEIRKIESS